MSNEVIGMLDATIGIGQYIVNDYVITIAEAQGGYGYTMTITRGTDTQTVTLYGLTPEQYDSMVGYLEQAQAASTAAQTAQDGAEDAREAAQAALNQAITYASNAATSASAAAQSAQDASDYDYQAAQARYAAVAAKEAAVAAQGAAEAAQTAAETASSNAGTSATNAATSATAAASSETSAAGSASAAAQSATNAAASATSAAQTLTSVQAEGAAQIAAIDAEGQEVLESIPADYTELSGDVADLKSAFDDLAEIVKGTETLTPTEKTTSDFTSINVYITPSVGYWSSAASGIRGWIIALGECVKVSVTANASYAAQIAFLSSDSHTAGEKANIVGGDLPTSITAGQTEAIDVPSGATHFYMRNINNDGYSVVPSEILFYHYETAGDGLVDDVDSIDTRLGTVETTVSGLSAAVPNKQDSSITLEIVTDTEIVSENDEASIAASSKHIDCTVAESDGVITLTVPASKGVQWLLFGGNAKAAADSSLSGDVTTVFEFDCTTGSTKTDATIVDDNNGTSAVRIQAGTSHVKVTHSGNTLKYVYLMVQDYASSQITIAISNVRLYYYKSTTESTTVVGALTSSKESLIQKVPNAQSNFQNPLIQPLSIDQDAELYKDIGTFNGATVSYDDGKIVLTAVSEWTNTQQWVIFGNSGTPVANYIPNDFIPAKATLEFDYTTNAQYPKVYVVNKNSTAVETTFPTGSGIHFKKTYNFTDIQSVFFNIEYSSDAGKTIELSNIRLYYGVEYDGTTVDQFVRFISQKSLLVSDAVRYRKLLTIGDSLSNICPWQPYVQNILNIPSMTKVGGVGYTVADVSAGSIYDVVQALTADESVDLIVFWGGTNDYGQGVTIGDFDTQLDTSTRDNETFYGALMDCVEHIIGIYPDKRIVLVGTIIRSSGGDDGKSVDGRTHTNSAGKTLVDYVDAVKKVAEWYGLPFIDLLRTAGISMENIDEYLYIQGDSPNKYYLHLNDWGSEQIGKRIGSYIKSVG